MRILAVSHEASATGAPIFFLTLLQWIKASQPRWEIDVVIVKDGIIRGQFESLGRSVLLAQYPEREQMQVLAQFTAGRHYDLVYTNTLETSHLLNMLLELGIAGSGVKVISHIHELEGTIRKYGAHRIRVLDERADRIVTVSKAVRDNLTFRHGFDASKIDVINPCSRFLVPQGFNEEDSEFFAARPNAKLILGCGEISVGKGIDVFIRTAMQVQARIDAARKTQDILFAWLGPDSYSIRSYFEKDLETLGIDHLVRFFGHRDSVYPFFEKADVFFMCSRQDSFPLVCLEAASLAKPIVYFPEAGGIKEFLGDSRGFPVPYLDDQAASEVITALVSDEAIGRSRGQAAQVGWAELYSSERVCGQIVEIIRALSTQNILRTS